MGFIWDRKRQNWLFLPVALLLAIMPFVLRATQHILNRDLYQLFLTDQKTEIFSQYRARFLWVAAAVMLVLLLLACKKLFSGMDRLGWFYLAACGVFFLFLILSALLSAHPDTAIWGSYDRAEGVITQVCYLILFLYTALAYRSTQDLKLLLAAFGVLIAVNAVMGISQFLGQDLMTSDFVNQLVVPEEIGGRISTMQFEKAKMYGTTNHYNYLGSIAAMTLPLCTILALFEKRRKFRAPAILAAALSLVLLLGSTSRAGLIGTVVAAVLGMVFFRSLLRRHWKIVLSVFGGLLVLTIGLNFLLNNAIFERVPMLLADVKTIFSDTSDFDYKDAIPIRGIKNLDSSVEITVQGDVLALSVENGTVSFRDQAGREVAYTANASGVLVTDAKAFSDLSFRKVNANDKNTPYTYLRLLYQGKQLFQFYYDESQIYLAKTNTTEPMTLEEPAVTGFLKGKELIGSMRGYIWSRTIPLLPDYLLVGAGPDCFLYVFPQDDVLGKLYAYGSGSMVVDKPHNLYLQIFVNEGGIALLAFLAVCIVYLWDCFRLYGGSKQDKNAIRGIAVGLGVAGYLFAGLFNDSTVMTATVFWILLGTGVGMNRQYRKERVGQ
ncbi:MAG: O-antigen ligase family protein [Oscillospiraceae bacterium]|nr:O-antigen ligase family protein [Oscillospiraceae bacterium]